MKAEITKDGVLEVIAENETELFALKEWLRNREQVQPIAVLGGLVFERPTDKEDTDGG